MSKHTPWPWRINADYPSVNVVGANGETVCEIYTRAGKDRDLIAAAPDLLRVCEEALKWCHQGHGRFPVRQCGLCGPLLAAVAKAKGET